MVIDLRTALPHLLVEAVAWAEARADEVAVSGSPPDDSGIAIARSVEVEGPERIRMLVVAKLPLPGEPTLREAALQSGLLGPGMVGLTLGYSVLQSFTFLFFLHVSYTRHN